MRIESNKVYAIKIMVCHMIALTAVVYLMENFWYLSLALYVTISFFLRWLYLKLGWDDAADDRVAMALIWLWWVSVPFLAWKIYGEEDVKQENTDD